MTQALTIINRALREIGVAESGQTLSADDAQLCLSALNVLADSWLTAPNYSYTTAYISAALADGSQFLSIGPGQALSTARPTRIEDAYATVGNVDYPIREITESEYLEIPLKSLNGPWPSVFFYDGGSPTGKVYFYPTGACTITLNVQTQLGQFADLTTDYTLPPGYERALSLTLAEEVAPMFSTQVSPVTMRNAKAARRDIKRANLIVPQLTSDPRLSDVTFPIVSSGNYSGVDGNT